MIVNLQLLGKNNSETKILCTFTRVQAQSRPTLCDPIVYQAPLSMGFSRQEYWSGVPFPYPGDLQKVLILQAHLVYFLFQSYNQSLSAGALLPFIEQQDLEPDWGTGYAHCYWDSFT